MSGIFQKLGDAISANINKEIETNTRPDVLAKYYADKAQEELNTARNRAAEVMADRKALEREVEQNKKDIAQMTAYAEKAMQAGNKEDARRCLEVKAQLSKKLAANEAALEAAKASEASTLAAYDEQAAEVKAMDSDMYEIRANVATATSKTASGNYTSGMSNRATTMFRKMKERSRRMVDEADSNAEIAARDMPVIEMKAKYDENVDVVSVELAALEQKYK